MNQVVRRPTVLVYHIQNFHSLAELFSALGSPCDHVHSFEEFSKKISTVSYSGVCIVATWKDLITLKPVLQELEGKSLLEGLRSVLMLVRVPGHEQVFAASRLPWLVQFQFSFLRDIIEIDAEPPALEQDNATRRLSFATQYDSRNPFAQRFSHLSRWRANAEISVPARMSWFEDDGNVLGIECGARIFPGSSVRILLNGKDDATTLVGNVKENLPGQLRFNFGNSIAIELLDASVVVLKRLMRNEMANDIIPRELKRAFLITRSLTLRQKLVRSFAKNDVDCRIPLVKRNILTDLPFLMPHFVVIEDRVLEDLLSRDGENILAQIQTAAGHGVSIAIVGEGLSRFSHLSTKFFGIPTNASMESSIDQWVSSLRTSRVSQSTHSNRTWFAHSVRLAQVTLVVEEKTHQLAQDGIVIRGQNQYRMWANIEVSIPGTGIQFIGKATTTSLMCDPFRNHTSVAIADSQALTFISSLTRSKGLFDETIRHLRAQIGNSITLPAPVESQKVKQTLEISNKLEAIIPEKTGPKPVKSDVVKNEFKLPDFKKFIPFFKKVFTVLFIFAMAGVLLYFLSLFKGNEGKVYSDSFRALFEKHGK